MNFFDLNILVYAHREDSPRHEVIKDWLTNEIYSDTLWAISPIILSGFIRVVTHPRIFKTPTPLNLALDYVDSLLSFSNCILIYPGERHWGIFIELCKKSLATGNLIPDAYLAALAIESGTVWITTDSDFARFPSLQWQNPLHVTK